MTTIVTQVPTQVIIRTPEGERIVVTQMGPAGSGGGGGGAVQNVFIGESAPSSPPATYLWIETGLGVGGTDMTFWVEDGQ